MYCIYIYICTGETLLLTIYIYIYTPNIVNGVLAASWLEYACHAIGQLSSVLQGLGFKIKRLRG